MPPARFFMLLGLVIGAAALTVGIAALAAPLGVAAWALVPLAAAAASILWRWRS